MSQQMHSSWKSAYVFAFSVLKLLSILNFVKQVFFFRKRACCTKFKAGFHLEVACFLKKSNFKKITFLCARENLIVTKDE